MKKIVAATAVIAAITLVGFGAWYLTSFPATYSGTPASITIGIPPLESAALIYIAVDQGYFARNGLNVTLRDYNPAIAGVDGLLNGEVDLAGASEYAVVVKAFKKENISIIVSGDEIQTNYLIGRKDRGIQSFSDLEGKKIGIPLGTNAEFYLGRFLVLHGIGPAGRYHYGCRPPAIRECHDKQRRRCNHLLATLCQ
jgi:NitT/TauT family transport system substrate-binding protein